MSLIRAFVVVLVASATLCAGTIETVLACGGNTGLSRSHDQDFDPSGRVTTAAEADADAEDEDAGAGSRDLLGCPGSSAAVAAIGPEGTGRLLTTMPLRSSRCRGTLDFIRGPPARA